MPVKSEPKDVIEVSVRWWDGYIEKFECSKVRFGISLLWMRLTTGQNRHLPLWMIRWYSVNPESHENITQEEE